MTNGQSLTRTANWARAPRSTTWGRRPGTTWGRRA
jgi:hypothetical protein